MITDTTTPEKEKRFCKVILKYNGHFKYYEEQI